MSNTDADEAAPDFAALYRDSDISPRNAAMVWWIGQLTADDAYDDVELLGSEPVTRDDSRWSFFDELPRITWRQDAAWRRRMARTLDDIVSDASAGTLDRMETPAEEMAIHRILPRCEAAIEDSWEPIVEDLKKLPSRPDDYDWPELHERLTHDIDIDFLFDPEYDGIEDPESEQNAFMRMGDYRPSVWFTPFGGRGHRDPNRGFRR